MEDTSNATASTEAVEDENDTWPVAPRTLTLLVGLTAIGAGFAYDSLAVGPNQATYGRWYAAPLDWLYFLSLVLLVSYVVVPALRNPYRARWYWDRLTRNRVVTVAVFYLLGMLVLGTVGPIVIGTPKTHIHHSLQPPLFATFDYSVTQECVGAVTNGLCHGSLAYPFGTTSVGMNMVSVVVLGMNVSLVVALVTAMFIVPIATFVGVVAGFVGGRVDDVLMRYVDIQQTVPAFVVYLIAIFYFGQSVFLIVVVFGLLNWGGVARLVRADVLQLREEAYIEAVEGIGASDRYIVSRHLLPELSNTLVTATTTEIPKLILAEAALSFLGLGDVSGFSWGITIQAGLNTTWTQFPEAWWISTIPVAFLSATVLSFYVIGDSLQNAWDPRDGSVSRAEARTD